MRKIIYIGIDDTDIPGGPGTGRIARGMGEYLESQYLGVFKAVIRHQLLVDPRIPYTSHNSSKCIIFKSDKSPLDLRQLCADYIAENFQKGSDPGLCIVTKDQIVGDLIEYGHLAQREYITKERAYKLANEANVLLSELGGTGDGIIGALAAVSLTVGGNDGRFVQLRGIKEIEGLISVDEILEKTDTVNVIDENGKPVAGNEMVDSMGWLRPSLVNDQPILRIKPAEGPNREKIWEPIEQRRKVHTDHEEIKS